MTTTVNVQDAKTRLSELLRRVEAGEEVVIARAGKPIARIEPASPRIRAFDAPLLPGIPPLDADVLLEPLDADELREWEDGSDGDPLLATPEQGAS